MKKIAMILGVMLCSTVGFAGQNAQVAHLRKQAAVAMQAGKIAEMEACYAHILKIKPDDEDAAFRLAQARSWQQDKMHLAQNDFQVFVEKHPHHKEAWIAYAHLESWCDHHKHAFALLENYKQRFGCTKEYQAARARILSMTGYYNQALALNDPLLVTDPDDYDLVYTRAHALYKANRFAEGRLELQKLQKIHPHNADNKELEKLFHCLEESIFALGVNYYQDNQGLKNVMLPFSLDYALMDNVHFLVKGLHEIVMANEDSGLTTINGGTTIYDNSFLAGFNWRIVPRLALIATVGDLNIEDVGNRFIYFINANLALTEVANLDVFHWRNLYRPYLFPTSPKAVSLGIVEDLTSAKMVWQPCFKTYINALVSYSHLSDDNNYTHIYVSPTKHWVLTSKTTLTLGVNADFLSFSQQLQNGYYDPSLHQEYLGIVGLDYNPTCNFSANCSIGAGVHRDQQTDLSPALSAYAGLVYVLRPWELNISGDYTYRGDSPGDSNYQGFSAQAQLGLHF